ncbi:MAG: hypothetical protein QNJ68_01375 [Microcoleaceae cyanobacterium MO_207.B10]|nr:hypothetical protein [Microcoleaceae cyanobacterium MO_207.B10]
MNFKVGWVERIETQQIPKVSVTLPLPKKAMLPQGNLQISLKKVGWVERIEIQQIPKVSVTLPLPKKAMLPQGNLQMSIKKVG